MNMVFIKSLLMRYKTINSVLPFLQLINNLIFDETKIPFKG